MYSRQDLGKTKQARPCGAYEAGSLPAACAFLVLPVFVELGKVELFLKAVFSVTIFTKPISGCSHCAS